MVKNLIALSLVLTIALAAVPQDRNFSGKIVGGSDAPDGEYPYQVSIRYGPKHSCGGSIISNDWILTAAHCVKGFQIFGLEVYAGSNSRSSGGIGYEVLEAHYHENFKPDIYENDVAVLKVKSITYTDKIQPIVLDSKEVENDEVLILSGWGRLSYPSGPFPENLQHIELTTIPFDDCKKRHGNGGIPVLDGEFCTFNKIGEGACKGDSGGPLVRKVDGGYKQVGIVSWGQPCATGLPDVFAKVTYYFQWIKEKCNDCI